MSLFFFFLQNSPLFQYLHDLGHTDFEACPTASQEEEYIDQEADLATRHHNPQKILVSFLSKNLGSRTQASELETKNGDYWEEVL